MSHDTGDDLAGQPQAPGLIGRQYRAEVPEGQRADSRRCQPRVDLDRLTLVGGPVFTRCIEHEFEKRVFQVMLEVRL